LRGGYKFSPYERMAVMKVGLAGLGNMGGRIAKRLIEQGNEVHVYDVDSSVLDDFETLGAKIADSPSELAANNKYVITVLPNSGIVKSVVFGEGGLIAGFQPGNVLIDMTSSVPDVTKEIGKELGNYRIDMLDAPVSGGVKKAEEGALTIMVGGDESVFTKALPLLEEIGSNIIHVGELGAGHTIKALNNLISATTLSITSEAMAIGVKLGLDPHKMLEVINNSTGRNNSSETKMSQQVLSRKFEIGFTLDLMYKDLTTAMEIARTTNVPAFVSGSVFQLWQYAWSQGGKDMDHTAIAKFIEEMANVEIKG
jgi:3-hydroxyisobutyrate dehydrogenase-like beta-hydroxyacid dehydrogenase